MPIRDLSGDDSTLMVLAIAYIDELISQRKAEHDDLVQQLTWLEQEKQRLLEDAAAAMRQGHDGR